LSCSTLMMRSPRGVHSPPAAFSGKTPVRHPHCVAWHMLEGHHVQAGSVTSFPSSTHAIQSFGGIQKCSRTEFSLLCFRGAMGMQVCM
jgi:hypothetical protein